VALLIAIGIIMGSALYLFHNNQSTEQLRQIDAQIVSDQKNTNTLLGAIKQASDRNDIELRCIASLFTLSPSTQITAIDLGKCNIQAAQQSAAQNGSTPTAANTTTGGAQTTQPTTNTQKKLKMAPAKTSKTTTKRATISRPIAR
jgi:hypothetical protein